MSCRWRWRTGYGAQISSTLEAGLLSCAGQPTRESWLGLIYMTQKVMLVSLFFVSTVIV